MGEIGNILKKAREKSGKTLEEVAQQTKIRIKYLKGIEDENFDIIPGGDVYIKGFIKSYAECVGLKGDEVVNKYKEIKEALKEKEDSIDKQLTKPEANDNESQLNKWKNKSLFLILIGTILLFSIGVFFFKFTGKQQESEQTTDVNQRDIVETNDEPLAQKENHQEDQNPHTVDSIRIVKVIDNQELTHYTVNREPLLRIKIINDSCWLKVMADNKQVFEGTLFKGNTQEFRGNSIIWMRVGNPQVIELNLNGFNLDVSYQQARNFKFEKVE